MAGAAAFGPARRAFTLAMLLAVYTFNFVDRQILGILAVIFVVGMLVAFIFLT